MIFHLGEGEHGFRISRETVDTWRDSGRGGKSMENYLPNFSRASNTRMATFHLSFPISPLNVRSKFYGRWIG